MFLYIYTIKQLKPHKMTTEKLTEANNLLRLITEAYPRIDQLKNDIKYLEYYSYNDFSMQTPEFNIWESSNIKKCKVNFSLDKNIIIKTLKDKLYVQENLLKKYTLEFDNL